MHCRDRVMPSSDTQSAAISTHVQSARCPIFFIPLVFYQEKQVSKITCLTPRLVLIYVALRLIVVGDNLLYSQGISYMPLSTYSLLCSGQLAFNVVFAFTFNRKKITPFILNFIVLLSLSAIMLGAHISLNLEIFYYKDFIHIEFFLKSLNTYSIKSRKINSKNYSIKFGIINPMKYFLN